MASANSAAVVNSLVDIFPWKIVGKFLGYFKNFCCDQFHFTAL